MGSHVSQSCLMQPIARLCNGCNHHRLCYCCPTSYCSLTVGTTYTIIIESTTADQGSFDICVNVDPCFNGIQDGTELGIDCDGGCAPCGGPATCTDNDDCTTAAPLTLNASGSGPACVADCNTGAAVGPNFAGNNCYATI